MMSSSVVRTAVVSWMLTALMSSLLIQSFEISVLSNSRKLVKNRVGTTTSSTTLHVTKYEPKWQKKKTLSEEFSGEGGKADFSNIGLSGSVPIVFQQGEVKLETVAQPGELIRNVASQVGQHIQYGCGKGECGTCECRVESTGQWIRPCVTSVPADLDPDETFTIILKAGKNKSVSSGKFYSVRSFFMGFYNNFIGMVGFVRGRKHAKSNWQERQDYEDKIRELTVHKQNERIAQESAARVSTNMNKNEKLAP